MKLSSDYKFALSVKLPSFEFGDLKPHEDSIRIEKDIFALADGVTRDPQGEDLTDKTNRQRFHNYPNPSPSRKAAEIFTDVFVETVLDAKVRSEKTIVDAYVAANNALKELNSGISVDYLANDYYSCVSAAGFIEKSSFYWGKISDCNIKILDKKGKIKFVSPENIRKERAEYIKRENITTERPEDRAWYRKIFRNNPDLVEKGKTISDGVLTGEKIAIKFIKTGSVNLNEDDLILLYSDGMEKVVNSANFYEQTLFDEPYEVEQRVITYTLSLQRMGKIGLDERSLILIRV